MQEELHIGKKHQENQPGIKEKIITGKGLEVIAQYGWKVFRETLKSIPYADIIDAQIQQIEELFMQADYKGTSGDHRDELRQRRAQTHERIFGTNGLIKKLSSPFQPKERFNYTINPSPYFAAQYDKASKFQITGNFSSKSWSSEIYSFPPVKVPNHPPIVRWYFNTMVDRIPEIYERLAHELSNASVKETPPGMMKWEQKAINFIELLLSEHNFLSPDSYDKQCTNKGVILLTDSVGASHALPAISEVINRMRQEVPELFVLPPRYEIQARIRILRDLMIPLGNIGYVELEDGGSYHARDLIHLENQIPRDLIGENEMVGGGGVSDYRENDIGGKMSKLKKLADFLRNMDKEKTFRDRKVSIPSLIN